MQRRNAVRAARALVVLAASTACASDPIARHPAASDIERDIGAVIRNVRNETGTPLLQDLQRLVAYDVFAVDPVCGLAEDPNPRVRSNAMWVLSQIQDPEYPAQMRAVDRALRRGLEDVEPTVRFEAASGLAARGAWDVLPILIEGLEHPDSGVRYRCHEQLLQTTSRNLGYAVDAPEADRRAYAARWRAWYEDWARTHG